MAMWTRRQLLHVNAARRFVSRGLLPVGWFVVALLLPAGAAGSAAVAGNLSLAGTGERNAPAATTDVWVHGRYAYTGTFDSPCGGESGAGIWVWDVHNKHKVELAGIIPSPDGSRSDDVKVAAMNSGDILVHSNGPCANGRGGFEIYDVDDPENPVHLASVSTPDVNLFLQSFAGLTDLAVHNLFLFRQGNRDYVAAIVESLFGNLQIFDISDPSAPAPVGFWGAEQTDDAVAHGVPPGVDWVHTTDVPGAILPVNAYLATGIGDSQSRFLHDLHVTADGRRAYLAAWDAGIILLDISDPAEPRHVSTALDATGGSLDAEVNANAVWASEDGGIVVEAEDDLDAWQGVLVPTNLTLDWFVPGDPTIPATMISTASGDELEAHPTDNIATTDGASVTLTAGPLAGNVYPAEELATARNSPTFATTGPLSGELVWIGRACDGDPLSNAASLDPGDIAVVRRGDCPFEEKANRAASLGAAAAVFANNQPSTPWGGLRIWDYSDPTDPVLASTFNTFCSASLAPGGDCDPDGIYTVQNVVVATKGKRIRAYVSWRSDGLLVLDVTDPYRPLEVGRYRDGNDFWGVHKAPGQSWVFGSDRNRGLFVLQERGAGAAESPKDRGPGRAE